MISIKNLKMTNIQSKIDFPSFYNDLKSSMWHNVNWTIITNTWLSHFGSFQRQICISTLPLFDGHYVPYTLLKWNWKLIMQNKTMSTICLVFSFFSSDLRVSVKDSLLCLRRESEPGCVSRKKSPVVCGTVAWAETGSPLFISVTTLV